MFLIKLKGQPSLCILCISPWAYSRVGLYTRYKFLFKKGGLITKSYRRRRISEASDAAVVDATCVVMLVVVLWRTACMRSLWYVEFLSVDVLSTVCEMLSRSKNPLQRSEDLFI